MSRQWCAALAALVPALTVAASVARAASPGVVVQQGEIVIMEGDSEIVGGTPGARELGPSQQVELLDRFYQHYPDEFDMVVVWMTWSDALNGGAYYSPSVPTPSIRSFGFVNMNRVGMWGIGVVPVIGQEFSHAWLAFASFVDPLTGQVSDEMLGRDGAHWSQLMDSDGSVQDGIDWEDNGDGTFTVVGSNNKWSMLDLWFMGFVSDDEVEDWFLLRDARVVGTGASVSRFPPGPGIGTTVTANKLVISIGDVIAAEGPQPDPETRQKDFRLAFVLITDIGETADSAIGTAEQLDRIRRDWDVRSVEWMLHRGSMCTDTTAPCNVPHARFVTAVVSEGDPADGDGIVEPGEHANVDVSWLNTGVGAASGATASLIPEDMRFTAPQDVVIADIPEGAQGVSRFDLELPAEATCGERATFQAVSHVDMREWRGTLELIPGVIEGPIERFASDGGFRGDLNGDDTAMSGGWDYGIAEYTENEGRTLQPDGGADGPDDPAWWTGREAGRDWKANDLDTGITTLTSAPMDLTGLGAPRLRYSVWFVALSFNTATPAVTTGDELVVEASDDDGATWVEIDRVDGAPRAWERREAVISGVDTDGPIRIRFVARDQGPEQNLVEVGIDDVQVVSISPDCGGGDGAGCCAVAGPRSVDRFAGMAFLALLVVSGGRRRRRRAR